MVRWFAIGWLATGCRAPELPDPVVEGVEPAFAYNGDDETVTIFGEAFYPQVAIDTWQNGPDVDKSFSAWLVGDRSRYEFVGVGITDDRHLSATLERGVPPGTYAVEVESPTGRTGRLSDAFTVTDAEAAQIVLQSPAGVVFEVTEDAEIHIELEDLGGDRVEIPFEIALTAPPTVRFVSNSLRGDSPTPEGNGIRGFVDDGVASVTIHATSSGPVTIEVAPSDAKSTVIGDTLDLAFQPGDDLRIALRLPPGSDPIPEFVAGEPIPMEAEPIDQFGNSIGGPLRVTLRTSCSGWVGTVNLDGPTPIEVVPHFVTSEACPEDTVLVDEFSGTSGPFTVRAGPPHHFAVTAMAQVQAGDVHLVVVDPEDVYGNRTTWAGVLSLVDFWGDPIPNLCDGVPNVQFCPNIPVRAGTDLTVTVTGDDGITGRSNRFTVLPDDVPETVGVEVVGPIEAGVPSLVRVRPYDMYGNVMNAASLGADGFFLEDPLGEASCTLSAFDVDGAAVFDCTLFTAIAGTTLTVDLPAWDIGATSPPFDVVNGPLAVVLFSGEATVVAGSMLTLALTAEDAYGNRYVVQSDPVVELLDASGTFSAPSATLAADGTADVTGFFTLAGVTTVRAVRAGVELGISDPIPVVAAGTARLRVSLPSPWAWEDEPLEIVVESVDTFGNRSGWSGTVDVSSRTTGSPDISLPVTNGLGTDTFTWTASAFPDTLDATGGPWSGALDVPVVRRCAVGPVPVVTFGGLPEAVACADPATGTGTVTADLSGSMPGLSPLDGFAVAEDGGIPLVDGQPLLALELVGIGRHSLRALAADTLGCGAEIAVSGWLGPDDGTPVGPIALVTPAVGIDPVDTVTIDVRDVVDCSGDPAVLQEIRVRSTAGDLSASETGSGLVLQLDANGDGVLVLETTGGLSHGDVDVHAGVPSGAAGGRLTLPISDDDIHPTVTAQDPSGSTSGTVSEIHLWFSEPMLTSVGSPGNFAVVGPTVTLVSEAELLPGETEVVLTLDPPVDAGLGTWLVTATSQLRDEAGNRIHGDWGSQPAPYSGAFGDVGGAPSAVSCTAFDPEALVLRPDGDPGLDSEADVLSVAVSSAETPAWWILEVRDAAGGLVRQEHLAPTGPSDTVVWNGRDLRGLVVPNGPWQVSIVPDDGLGNRGAGCERTVTVDNWFGVSP